MTDPELTVLIADDEPAARRGVRQLLADFPEVVVVGECKNGEEVLMFLNSSMPDVLFLDIQMPGLSGFEVIRRLIPERMPAIVFLTAFDQFALNAFDVEALDYLVKPVSKVRFAATMKRLFRLLGNAENQRTNDRLVVTTRRGIKVLYLSEIDWIESADNYVRLWVAGRSYLLRESLQTLEKRAATHGFIRAHRRALVRLNAVKELTSNAKGAMVAVLASGNKIIISRRRRQTFAAAIRGKIIKA